MTTSTFDGDTSTLLARRAAMLAELRSLESALARRGQRTTNNPAGRTPVLTRLLLAELARGRRTALNLARATGQTERGARQMIWRLMRKGRVVSPERGWYALPEGRRRKGER